MRIAALWLAAALISGFTLRRYLGPLDEGILMQAASRMAHGQWPWRDFGWSYGPGEPVFVLAANQLFGSSLLWWRLLRVAADATAAVLVWALVRPERPRWAFAAWAAAALTAAQPTSANPTSPALALSLAAVLLARRGHPGWAGLAAACAAFWRPDVGAIAALAAALTWLATRAHEDADPRPARGVVVCLGVALAGVAVLYAPFAAVAGPGRVWTALVVQATRDGAWWRLPFPAGFPGGNVKDFATWLLPYGALVVLALGVLWRTAWGLVVLGVGAAVYYLSRADLEHAQGLLVIAAALAALVRPKLVGAVMLALLIAVGGANRASALLRPPQLEAYRGVLVPPSEAENLPKLIAEVHALVPAGEPIYVAPLRSDLVTFSNPLLYYLVGRPNALRRDFLLQARPAEQRNIIDKLPRVVIRWTNPESARPEPNRRGRPSGSTALSDYLAAHYRRVATYGEYEVLARDTAG